MITRVTTLSTTFRNLVNRLHDAGTCHYCTLCHARHKGEAPSVCSPCYKDLVDASHIALPEGVHAFFAYQFPLDKALHRFKYQGHPKWQRVCCELFQLGLTQRLNGEIIRALEHAEWVVPVPMTRKKKANRGFNQSELLANLLCQSIHGLTLREPIEKVRETPQQATLNRAGRRENLSGAFALKKSEAMNVQDKWIVLVDDVCTTGATLEALRDLLLAGGARQVSAICLAATEAGRQ